MKKMQPISCTNYRMVDLCTENVYVIIKFLFHSVIYPLKIVVQCGLLSIT